MAERKQRSAEQVKERSASKNQFTLNKSGVWGAGGWERVRWSPSTPRSGSLECNAVDYSSQMRYGWRAARDGKGEAVIRRCIRNIPSAKAYWHNVEGNVIIITDDKYHVVCCEGNPYWVQ